MSRSLAPRTNGSGNFETEIVNANGEIMDLSAQPTALESITRAEIDIQISTAKRYPRSIAKFVSEAKTMVSIDPDLAAQCTYWLPARQGSSEQITGPSVRLSEIVAVCWGNLRVVGRITDDDGKFVTAQGVAIDLERNVGYSVEVRRGVVTKQGKRFGDDMIKVTCNAAIAIATRNAVFKCIPRAFVNLIEEEAMRVAKGDVKSLGTRTESALDWFRGKGVKEESVFLALGITGREDMTLDLLGKLNGMRTAVKDGTSSIDELFAVPAPIASAPPTVSKASTLAGKLAANAAPEPREPGSDG